MSLKDDQRRYTDDDKSRANFEYNKFMKIVNIKK